MAAIPAAIPGVSSFKMPAMPQLPNLSADDGPPPPAKSGNAMGGGGFDGSNWAVNFGGQTGVGTAVPMPAQIGFRSDAFGMPSVAAMPGVAGAVATNGAGIVLSPLVMAAGALALVLILRRRG